MAFQLSVCIPTFNRPELLLNCVKTIISQSILPSEILIGDDSPSNETEEKIKELNMPENLDLIYQHNQPSLGQAHNVQALFEMALGDWLLLIHDDDWLLPDAIKHLTEPIEFDETIDAVYGNQLVAEADGTIDLGKSEALNLSYHRTPEWAGKQKNSLLSAALGQFPNNGWIVRRSLACKAGYPEEGIEDGCDFAFGLKIASLGAQFYYQQKETVVYRLSPVSIARGNLKGSTATLDAARLLWRFRHDLPHTSEMNQRFRACFYQAGVWCGLHGRHRLEAMKWTLHPRLGINWFGRSGVGIVSAMIFPNFREKTKKYIKSKY